MHEYLVQNINILTLYIVPIFNTFLYFSHITFKNYIDNEKKLISKQERNNQYLENCMPEYINEKLAQL